MTLRAFSGPEYRYSLDDAARFLQYDRETVRYWLRTGHLAGRRDPRTGEWVITNRDLIAFIRTGNEPMPTGVRGAERIGARGDAPPSPGEVRRRVSVLPN